MSDYVHEFDRVELKYRLHYRQVQEFLERARSYVRLDEHVGREGFYKVVSLYYDSPDLRCYREKIDGEKFRRKLRVRTYGERPDEAFVEIKQRYNMTVQKRRCRAPIEAVEGEMRKMEAGRYQGGPDPVFDHAFNLRRRYGLVPKLVVSYNRAALFDHYQPNLRITIDRNIRCRSFDLNVRNARTRGVWVIPPTLMVLEVKFNGSIARWLCNCLNGLNLIGERFSKYSAGIERLRMQERV